MKKIFFFIIIGLLLVPLVVKAEDIILIDRNNVLNIRNINIRGGLFNNERFEEPAIDRNVLCFQEERGMNIKFKCSFILRNNNDRFVYSFEGNGGEGLIENTINIINDGGYKLIDYSDLVNEGYYIQVRYERNNVFLIFWKDWGVERIAIGSRVEGDPMVYGINQKSYDGNFTVDRSPPVILDAGVTPKSIWEGITAEVWAIVIDIYGVVSSVWVDIYDGVGNFVDRIFLEKQNDTYWNVSFDPEDYGLNDTNFTAYFQANDTSDTPNIAINVTYEFEDVTQAPVITFISPTENNGKYMNISYIYINVSIVEVTLINTTFYLYNETGVFNKTTYVDGTKEINISIPDLGQIYSYNVSSADTYNNVGWSETRYITRYLGGEVPVSNVIPFVNQYGIPYVKLSEINTFR